LGNNQEENDKGTVISNKFNAGTMVINEENGEKKNTIQEKKSIINENNKKSVPEFMKYINEMDISYDEYQLETDLF